MSIAWRIRWRPSARANDLIVVAAVAFPTTMDAWSNQPGTRPADAFTYLLVAVSLGALVMRRRWPMTVALVCAGALVTLYLLGHEGEVLSLPSAVAVYTVALQGERHRTMAVGALAVLWFFGAAFADASVATIVLPVGGFMLGETVRNRRRLLVEHAARADQRMQEERLQIARELHDILAHTVTAMNLQAGVAVDAFETRPEVARRALEEVRTSGRDALQELRATVAVLREESAPDTTPAPHLDQLDELVERTRSTGLSVTLRREPEVGELPAVIGLAAYRIVQEALTNVIRHAHARHAAVTVTRVADDLVVEITDDGRGANGHGPGNARPSTSGFGLVGIIERTAAVGGRAEYGPMPGRGFRVRAVLPATGRP